MEERVKVLDCKCGGSGIVYEDDCNPRQMYYVKCQCGRRTPNFSHIDGAVRKWNEMNKPNRAVVRNVCGFCGAEVFSGFKKCPKCDAELEW